MARGDMRERKKRERDLSGLPTQAASCLFQIRRDVTVRKHHAFRHSRRTRGVDDGSEIIWNEGSRSGIEFGIALDCLFWAHDLAHEDSVGMLHVIHHNNVLKHGFAPDAKHFVELLSRRNYDRSRP